MTKYLHTMVRVSSLEDTIAFFEVLGLREIRRRPDEKGRYTNVWAPIFSDLLLHHMPVINGERATMDG